MSTDVREAARALHASIVCSCDYCAGTGIVAGAFADYPPVDNECGHCHYVTPDGITHHVAQYTGRGAPTMTRAYIFTNDLTGGRCDILIRSDGTIFCCDPTGAYESYRERAARALRIYRRAVQADPAHYHLARV
jgi:hypothetical protein